MDDSHTGPLKSIDRLVSSLAKRVTFWPPVQGHETETLKWNFARMLTEKYIEILGPTRVANIIRKSATELEILEALSDELALEAISRFSYPRVEAQGMAKTGSL